VIANGIHDVAGGKLTMAYTHLEMCVAPDLPDLPEPAGLRFRPLSFEPAPYRDLFRRVGQDWLWYYRLTLGDAELSAHFADPGVQLFTLRKDGQDEAMLELDFRTKGACELAYFGLTPALIGTGAGRYLMRQATRLAWARPISRMHLYTCNYDSPQAMGFYLRTGFTPFKRTVEVDDDPRLSGILPETAAPHVPIVRP